MFYTTNYPSFFPSYVQRKTISKDIHCKTSFEQKLSQRKYEHFFLVLASSLVVLQGKFSLTTAHAAAGVI